MKKGFLLILFSIVIFSLKGQMTLQNEDVKLHFSFDSINKSIHLQVTNLSKKTLYLNARKSQYDYVDNGILTGYYRACMCIENSRVDLLRPSEGERLVFNRILPYSIYVSDINYVRYDSPKKIESSVFNLYFTFEYLLQSEEQYIEDMMRNEDLMRFIKEHDYKIHTLEIKGKVSLDTVLPAPIQKQKEDE